MFEIPISKKNFENVLKNGRTPRGISVVLDDNYTHYWAIQKLPGIFKRRGELGWAEYVVGREGVRYRTRIISAKKDGKLIILETRIPEELHSRQSPF